MVPGWWDSRYSGLREDVTGGLAAQPHLDAVNAVHRRIARRRTPQDLKARPGQEPEVRKVIADLLRQVQLLEYPGAADSNLA